ncbi:MAG: hypothetical protein R2912_02735 [Eubacteriales bacterium]
MLLQATVGNDVLSGIEVKGGTLSRIFLLLNMVAGVLTATQGEVDINAIANSGVKVSIGNTGIPTAKYTIKSGNSKTIRISVGGVVKYSIYLVRDVLTVGTWNIKRGNDNPNCRAGWIAAQRPDIPAQEVYINTKEGKNNLLSVRTKNAQYTAFAETIKYPLRWSVRYRPDSKFKPENEQVTLCSPAKPRSSAVYKRLSM